MLLGENVESRYTRTGKTISSRSIYQFMGLIVRSSEIHAAGVYATAPIKKNTHVVEYTGPRISRQKADELYEGYPYTYLFGLDDGVNIIDGTGIGRIHQPFLRSQLRDG